MLPKTGCFALLLILLAGCKNHDPVRANMIDSRPLLIDTETKPAIERRVEVQVVDARSASERRSFDELATFVPLENLQPSPTDCLASEVQWCVAALPDPPSEVHLELHSLRVVSQKEVCGEKQDAFPHLEPLWLPGYDNSSCSANCLAPLACLGSGTDARGALVVLGVIFAVVGVIEVGIIGYDATVFTAYYVRHANHRLKQLTTDHGPSRACEIRVSADAHWQDGHTQMFDVWTIVRPSDLKDEESLALVGSNEITALARAACKSVAREIQRRILNPTSPSLLPDAMPVPAFTAYSGN
jgi:hypothetical protein